jgi:DNA-binding MarR family transcriptional regulator
MRSMPTRRDGRSDRGWTFVTSHLVVLLCIAEDRGIRIKDLAERVGITERAVQSVLRDLEEGGYVARRRVGRRNEYTIARNMPLRHLEVQHHRLDELLSLFAAETPKRSARRTDSGRR